jgi:hypothetical protein
MKITESFMRHIRRSFGEERSAMLATQHCRYRRAIAEWTEQERQRAFYSEVAAQEYSMREDYKS